MVRAKADPANSEQVAETLRLARRMGLAPRDIADLEVLVAKYDISPFALPHFSPMSIAIWPRVGVMSESGSQAHLARELNHKVSGRNCGIRMLLSIAVVVCVTMLSWCAFAIRCDLESAIKLDAANGGRVLFAHFEWQREEFKLAAEIEAKPLNNSLRETAWEYLTSYHPSDAIRRTYLGALDSLGEQSESGDKLVLHHNGGNLLLRPSYLGTRVNRSAVLSYFENQLGYKVANRTLLDATTDADLLFALRVERIGQGNRDKSRAIVASDTSLAPLTRDFLLDVLADIYTSKANLTDTQYSNLKTAFDSGKLAAFNIGKVTAGNPQEQTGLLSVSTYFC